MEQKEEEADTAESGIPAEGLMRANLMPKTKKVFRLIKWDAEQAPEKAVEHPEQDPRCAEILEWELGGPLKQIYKKE